MIRVYIAESLADAHLVCNLVQQAGISARVFNEHVHGALGELPFTHTWPEVWIVNEDDEQSARQLIEAKENAVSSTDEIECPRCAEVNPANFETCWNCSVEL